jgi:hypothetical protein
MVQANIDNTPVSITLAENESVSVPTGETWRVTISAPNDTRVDINGGKLINSYNGSGEKNMDETQTVVTEGDSIANDYSTNSGVLHVGGFKV